MSFFFYRVPRSYFNIHMVPQNVQLIPHFLTSCLLGMLKASLVQRSELIV